jgi:hypothetical protein
VHRLLEHPFLQDSRHFGHVPFLYVTDNNFVAETKSTYGYKRMTVDTLKATYDTLPNKFVKARSDTFFRIEENKPTTFFVLTGGANSFPEIVTGGYSSKGLGWVHPIDTHFLNKRIVCTKISGPTGCFICDRLKGLEEDLAAFKQDTDEVTRTDPDKGNKMLLQAQDYEKQMQDIGCHQKYAINILVKGQDVPVTYEADKSLAKQINQMFETSLKEDGINIFDPLLATTFTVTKVGKGLAAKYTVIPSPRPEPIITGERQEERIKAALLAGINFDEMYTVHSRTEQIAAWDAFLHPGGFTARTVHQVW